DQARRIDSIADLVNTRLKTLEALVDLKKAGGSPTVEQLESGKFYMDSCRTIIESFVAEEADKLGVNAAKMQQNSGLTSFFIVFAAMVSLIVKIGRAHV